MATAGWVGRRVGGWVGSGWVGGWMSEWVGRLSLFASVHLTIVHCSDGLECFVLSSRTTTFVLINHRGEPQEWHTLGWVRGSPESKQMGGWVSGWVVRV